MNFDYMAGEKDMPNTKFLLTEQNLETYLQAKISNGVSPVSVAKYKTPLFHLHSWLGEDKELSTFRLQAWRKSLDEYGYGKITVQKYVVVINTFLRANGRSDLCIPKPVKNELAGRTFGYLTALEPTGERHHRYVVWHCICKCGKEVDIPSGMLLGGHTTSCGCLNTEIFQHCNRYEEGTDLRHSLAERIMNPNSASGYVGVQPKRGKWFAYINYKGVRYNLGTYSRIEDAVKARARAKEAVMEDATRIYEETDHLYGEAPRRPPRPEKIPFVQPDPVSIPARRGDNTSGYTGVTRSKGKWVASISVKKYRYRLGAYDELETAVAVRQKAEDLVAADDLDALKVICTNWRK